MLNTSDLEPGARVCPRSLPRALCICTVGEDRAARGSGPSYMWRIIGQRIAGARGVAAEERFSHTCALLFLLVTRENAKKKFVPCSWSKDFREQERVARANPSREAIRGGLLASACKRSGSSRMSRCAISSARVPHVAAVCVSQCSRDGRARKAVIAGVGRGGSSGCDLGRLQLQLHPVQHGREHRQRAAQNDHLGGSHHLHRPRRNRRE